MISAEEISFSIGTFELRRLSIDIAEGEYFILLGPPGSGKTVFLECLCGLKKIRSGKIRIDGRDVTNLEPRRRGIGYVPQDYALFPHLSVERNIAFGLRIHGYAETTDPDPPPPTVDSTIMFGSDLGANLQSSSSFTLSIPLDLSGEKRAPRADDYPPYWSAISRNSSSVARNASTMSGSK